MTAISDILENIPQILEYFIPGYCMIIFYRRLNGKNGISLTDNIHLGACVIISFFIQVTINIFYIIPIIGTLIKSWLVNVYIRCIIECFIGSLLAITIIRIHNIKIIRNNFQKINSSAISNTVFECCNMHHQPYITVYGEGICISGRLVEYNLDDNDAWLALDYCKIKRDGQGIIDSWVYHKSYERYLIPVNEVKSIAVHYDASSSLPPKDYSQIRSNAMSRDKIDMI